MRVSVSLEGTNNESSGSFISTAAEDREREDIFFERDLKGEGEDGRERLRGLEEEEGVVATRD